MEPSEPELPARPLRKTQRARTVGAIHFQVNTEQDSDDDQHDQPEVLKSCLASPRSRSARSSLAVPRLSRVSVVSRGTRRSSSAGFTAPRSSCEVPLGHVMSLASELARSRAKPKFMLSQTRRNTVCVPPREAEVHARISCDSGGTMSDEASADPIASSPRDALPRICVLGGGAAVELDRCAHVTSVASRLAAILRQRAVVLIDGRPGLQDTFARGLGDFDDVFYVLPPEEDAASPKVLRRSCAAGLPHTDAECSGALADLGDVYLIADDSAETSRQAAAALARGALVLPLDADACADLLLPRPDLVPEAQWVALTALPPTHAAIDAIVEVVSRRVLGSSVVDVLADLLSRQSSAAATLQPDQPTEAATVSNTPEASIFDAQHAVPAFVMSVLVPLAYILF